MLLAVADDVIESIAMMSDRPGRVLPQADQVGTVLGVSPPNPRKMHHDRR
jgi:hypothetical protein